jgi:hypothetical protein
LVGQGTPKGRRRTYLESGEKVEGSRECIADNAAKEEERLKDEENDSGKWSQYKEDGVGDIVENEIYWIDDPIQDG